LQRYQAIEPSAPDTSRSSSLAGEPLRFPQGFLWGTATAAYQIEGAVSEDGRGASIWDTFTHTPGKVFHGDNGDVACDHYRRYAEDIEIMRDLGINAYRFSVAWPRVQPDGRGTPNQAGLDFYRRLVGKLREHGIEPVLTLYHWDLPQALQDEGGWANRATVDRFVEYAESVASALRDQVDRWITLNEPWVSAFVGHESGQHAPGLTDTTTAVTAAHHLLLAHGRAVRALRSSLPASSQVGVTLNLSPVHAATLTGEDVEAAERVNAYLNGWFLEPTLRGNYPEELYRRLAEVAGEGFNRPGDLEEIRADIDFLGVNYYTVRNVASTKPGALAGGPGTAAVPTGQRALPAYLEAVEVPLLGVERTTKGWAIRPDGLRELLVWLRDKYGKVPIYVTENGAAFADYVDPSGQVKDPERVEFLRKHFIAAHRAISQDVDLRGYFVWSLLDNFEWADGYSQRFGLVYVDYKSQERIPKSSAAFFSEVARYNAVCTNAG
jgi:beta-glucosidase